MEFSSLYWTFVQVIFYISFVCLTEVHTNNFSIETIGSNNLSHRIYLLQDTLNRATAIVSEAESRLDEISIQLSVLQKQCTYRDRPLCDTIHIKNMDESGLNLKFKKVICLCFIFVKYLKDWI